MKRLFVVQVCAFIVISGALGGLLFGSSVYYDVRCGIVSVVCFSCIKLDPKAAEITFVFETATGDPHPAFVLENLTLGPVFLAFRADVCEACDTMEPILKEIFSLEFEKEETFATTIVFDDANVTFIHINIDHASPELRKSLFIYDKEDYRGVPMFTLITFGDLNGSVKPCYTSVYGLLNLRYNEDREALLRDIILRGIYLHKENHETYLEG